MVTAPQTVYEDRGLRVGLTSVVAIVVTASVGSSLRELIAMFVFLPRAREPSAIWMGIAFVLLTTVVSAFMVWFLCAGLIHTVLWYRYELDPEFRTTALLTGLGFVPQVFIAVVVAPATYAASTRVSGVTSIAFINNVQTHPFVLAANVVFLACIFWTGYHWANSVAHAHDLSYRKAAGAVVLPTALLLLWNLYGTLAYMVSQLPL